jgi:superfamily II DNA or RNA helicase
VLFLAHQIEILLQSVTAFKNVLGIGAYSYSACFNGSDPEDTDFVFASFDTLYAKLSSLSQSTFDVVIVDEAHHTPARTYAEVVQHFRPKLLIGLTATPQRADSQNVMTFFGGSDGHIGKFDLAWGLRHNKLAFPKYEVLLDDLSQERLSQLQQGLTVADIDQKLFLHKKDEEVVSIIEKTVAAKQIKNVKGIVFCRSIQHMRHLIQFFAMGSATLVHSRMNDMERRDNIRNFREGAFKFILVCDLFNEGIDIPETNLLVFMRATGSRTVWLQQLGRGLRKTPNKEYVHVLDFVGSLDRLNDVRTLQQAVRQTPINRDDWEPRPRAEHDVVHDSTLEVSYSQSAAQVLKLIEDLEYRLASRGRLIERLQDYVKDNRRLPSIEELEIALPNVTCDQVATFFDSYYRYVIAAVPTHADADASRERLSTYVQDYARKYGIAPSARAVSNAFKYRSLEAYIEEDVIYLIGNIDQVVQECLERESAAPLDEAPTSKTTIISDSGDETHACRMHLIEKYRGAVATVHELRALSADDRAEIKEAFQSDFYFLKVLREASNDDDE